MAEEILNKGDKLFESPYLVEGMEGPMRIDIEGERGEFVGDKLRDMTEKKFLGSVTLQRIMDRFFY